MTLRGYPMAVEFSLQGTGQKISSTQRQLRICGDANRCRSPLGVRNVLRLVVLWGGGGLNRFPTNTKELVGLKKKRKGREMSADLEGNDKTSLRPLVYHRFQNLWYLVHFD